MPELPEVETTVRKLRPLLKGKRFLDLKKEVVGVERRGKAILIWLEEPMRLGISGNLRARPARAQGIFQQKNIRVPENLLPNRYLLAFHQRMSGKLLVVERAYKDKYIRKRFRLSDGKDLVFHDVRRFGVAWYGPAEKVLSDAYFRTLGIDALSVTPGIFDELFASKKMGKIKAFLLDQKNLAGIGNIMADEILWRAKIHPERKISSLEKNEIKKYRSP